MSRCKKKEEDYNSDYYRDTKLPSFSIYKIILKMLEREIIQTYSEIILYALVAVLHLFGILLLQQSKKFTCNRIHILLLTVFSTCDAVNCTCTTVRRVLKLFAFSNVEVHLKLYQWTSISAFYYLIILFITVDRLLMVYLGIRYNLECTYLKTVYGVLCCVGTSVGVGFIFFFTVGPNNQDIIKATSLYMYPIMDFVFIIVATVTYSYIFQNINHSFYLASIRSSLKKMNPVFKDNLFPKSEPTTEPTTKTNADGDLKFSHSCLRILLQIRYSRRILTQFLIVVTFVLFIVIPDQIYFYSTIHNMQISFTCYLMLNMAYFLAYASDVFIVYLHPPCYKVLKKIVRNVFANT